ncbi:MAG: VWA domain-containing protein [Saprospiraceae bacterium]|nr:VWA domain-containing protein [Saprospiraceae bacterium]
MTLAAPLWLLLLLPLAALFWRERRLKEHDAALRLPQNNAHYGGTTWRTGAHRWLMPMRWAALGCLVVAMARPQKTWVQEKVKADAIDIVLTLDISPSMLSRDFEPDRLAVAKRVAIDFVEKRPHDRIGLVAFSAEAFTQCPLTTDRRVVQAFIRELQTGRLEDGTAIGMGLATAVNRLKDSPSRSKIVILLTDGENNAGYISPLQAAEIAQSLGVRVYTVGIGTEGIVMSPARRLPDNTYAYAPRYMTFDTELLRQIAQMTEGKYYRAYSEADLKDIYDEIDRLEKTKIEVSTVRRTTDYFHWLIGVAVVLLSLEILGRWWILRTVTM